jgi:hypothetical protein
LVPELYGPIYKGIFSEICLLLSTSNFPVMIDPAQIAWLLQPVTYGLPCPFSRVGLEECKNASYLSALHQDLSVQIILLMCKFSRFVCTRSRAFISPCFVPNMTKHIQE